MELRARSRSAYQVARDRLPDPESERVRLPHRSLMMLLGAVPRCEAAPSLLIVCYQQKKMTPSRVSSLFSILPLDVFLRWTGCCSISGVRGALEQRTGVRAGPNAHRTPSRGRSAHTRQP